MNRYCPKLLAGALLLNALASGLGAQTLLPEEPDILEPELEKAYEATRGIAQDIGDVLTYALYPTTGMRFLRWKYGLEVPPPEVKPKTMEDVKREDELIAKAKAGKLVEMPPKGANVRTFNVYVGEELYSIGVEAVGAPPLTAPANTPAIAPLAEPATTPVVAPPVEPVEEKVPPEVAKVEGTTIVAPMPGIIIRYEVTVGDEVKAGDAVVILEAMKMANALTTPVSGRVKTINFKSGDRVAREDVLAVIG